MLAFPCNQFGGQEPGTPDQIKAFAARYKATYVYFGAALCSRTLAPSAESSALSAPFEL